jgi:glycosyltransferase involved in cell wall biosynthesis
MPPSCSAVRSRTRLDAMTEGVASAGARPILTAPDAPGSRILHVVSSVDRGGIEIWLLHLLRHLDRQLYATDVLVLNNQPGPLEEDLRALGCRVFFCPGSRKPWILQRRFAEILRRHGPYDIVQSHVHHSGGLILRIAAKSGIPVRIAHSRNDTRPVVGKPRLARRLYMQIMSRWINAYATRRIAISRPAADDLFGPGWNQDGRCSIIYSGRDLSAFTQKDETRDVRRSLGLPANGLVMGHVGRFHERKNHRLIVEVAAEVFRQEPSAHLLLVGDGVAEDEVRAQVHAVGIADRTVFAGARADVPKLLSHAMDVFVFPSHHEGLGVAVVEAQAAGLPCVIADHLPSEIDLVPELIARLPVGASAPVWAVAVLGAARQPKIDREKALGAILASDFNIERSAAKIADVYATELARVRGVGFNRADDARENA